ncbi:alpha/beta hydrolase [Streptomyces sp. ME19-01-6]|uniref:alpha/beta hydrolase n=1 Tax=Streptomyces sp. ME19-01-6 TaxID=3028686 RepID=UPI0029A41714|nr:alpha/beta hydrolase [Streptomyces sp. ME19-01-6]MDX3224730.1 alpha/beta hydrolase [Streptomyces sp. ME19-01-6]
MSHTPVGRHGARSLITAALMVTVMAGTVGWTLAHEQQPVTGPPPGTAAWRADHSPVPGAAGRLPDPATASPAGIARFFAGLTAAEQRALALRHPSVVGNLDGVPVALRYTANALAIRAERAKERAADPKSPLIDRYTRLLAPGRRILAFDPRGRGQVAEVYGDLTTAQRTAVLVPGSDTDLSNFDRADHPYGSAAGMARSLRAQMGREAPGVRTAVVAWVGYTTPLGLGPDAATGRLAKAGVPRLDRFLAGLAATAGEAAQAPPAVFCHSYGSVVCGLTASRLDHAEISDLVVFGSPGVRAGDAADLGPAARVWAARDGSDWVRRVTGFDFLGLGHGEDPTDPSFGARVVSADRAHGHTGYFAPGTDSLRNFARIALGHFAAVHCAEGAGYDHDCRHGLA